MRALVFAVNVFGRVGEWVLSRADRKPCEFSNLTDDECCEVCGSDDVHRRGDWDYCAVGHIYVGKRAGLT